MTNNYMNRIPHSDHCGFCQAAELTGGVLPKQYVQQQRFGAEEEMGRKFFMGNRG